PIGATLSPGIVSHFLSNPAETVYNLGMKDIDTKSFDEVTESVAENRQGIRRLVEHATVSRLLPRHKKITWANFVSPKDKVADGPQQEPYVGTSLGIRFRVDCHAPPDGV